MLQGICKARKVHVILKMEISEFGLSVYNAYFT